MPDIDIDFHHETRDKVVEYVRNKYGEKSVAQIVSFGTLKSRQVIKDVSRVLGLPLDKVNKITKEIGFQEKISDARKKATLE
jgi:DNA polymerase-3 subunit alpha